MEGQSELIFVRHLLEWLIPAQDLSFECLRLHASRLDSVPYKHSPPDAKVHYLLVNVGNDSSVITAIKDREQSLFDKGYSAVIGLRDMYSEAYQVFSHVIDNEIITKFVDEHNRIIKSMSRPTEIHFVFSIMEIEAWVLSMFNLFAKVDTRLTVSFIETNLGINLQTVDAQAGFFHPSVDLGRVLGLVGISYRKTEDDIEKLASRMDDADILNAIGNGRCSAFNTFIGLLEGF